MIGDNVLIRRILSGDDEAFRILVQKHRKGVHALIWRKIGDFHVAEEIAQDTFVQVYKKLGTLQDPNRFEGWLYVIANRLCINWIQRNKPKMDIYNMQSLEETPPEEVEEASYLQHTTERLEAETIEKRQALVKRLLEKLPESERTVVTLYYLGEMTAKEIGKFLGVSVNTIKSRLRRARKRLEDEETLVRETLGTVKLSNNFIENVMQRVENLTPMAPPVKKPWLPWVALGTATVLVYLMLGVSSQHLAKFQKPYSLETESESTVELIDATVLLDIDTKPALENRIGRSTTASEDSGNGLQLATAPLTLPESDNDQSFATPRWQHANAPGGSLISEIFRTSKGHLYATASTGIYKLSTDATQWVCINTSIPIENSPTPMQEHDDTLYILSSDAVFTSDDGGATWRAVGPRPKGRAIGFLITGNLQKTNAHADILMYVAIEAKGVFRSDDAGQQWSLLDDGLADTTITTAAAIRNTVFAGTNRGLYRLDADTWRLLPVDTSRSIYTLAVSENNLYAGTGPDPFNPGNQKWIEARGNPETPSKVSHAPRALRIFHSSDLGSSWSEITPNNKSRFMRAPASLTLSVVGQTVLVQNIITFRSEDNGQTWTDLGINAVDPFAQRNALFPGSTANIFYKVGTSNIHRTTDGGRSWHPFMNGILGSNVKNLVTLGDRLYIHTGTDIAESTNDGRSWRSVSVDLGEPLLETDENRMPQTGAYHNSKLIRADNALYMITPERASLHIFRLSTNRNTFRLIQKAPALEHNAAPMATKINDTDVKLTPFEKHPKTGGFTVSDRTFYLEYKRELFKWHPGSPKWTNMGLIDTGEQPHNDLQDELKLAVSDDTIYVGKRDGRLFQSLDGGSTWKRITGNLPLPFNYFKAMVFADTMVYIATDNGVLTSPNGEHWRVVLNAFEKPIIIDKFAVDGKSVYGVGDTGIYRLAPHGKWKQISPDPPDKVTAVAINNDRLYIATEQRGIFHIPLKSQ